MAPFFIPSFLSNFGTHSFMQCPPVMSWIRCEVRLLSEKSSCQKTLLSIVSNPLRISFYFLPLPPLLLWALRALETNCCCSANFVSYCRGRKKWFYLASTSTVLTVTFGSMSISLHPGSVCQIISQPWRSSGQETLPGTPWSWFARYEATWGRFFEKSGWNRGICSGTCGDSEACGRGRGFQAHLHLISDQLCTPLW